MSSHKEKADMSSIEDLFGNQDPVTSDNVGERIDKLCTYLGYNRDKVEKLHPDGLFSAYGTLLSNYFIRKDREDIGY